VSGYKCLARLQSCEKAMGLCTALYKMLLFHAYTQVRARFMQYCASPSEERRRKTFWPFWCFLVQYFCDAFPCH